MSTVEANGHGSGGIDDLPDGVLEHILGFLPAEDAVRTSVLAPRWRHLWKSAPGLHIGCRDVGGPGPVKQYRRFVNYLLLSRRCLPLDTYEITVSEFEADDMPLLNLWVLYAIECKVMVLRVCAFSARLYLQLYDRPLVSRNLRRLELHGVQLYSSATDFSRCRVLEHLELHGCGLYESTKIMSQSLRHLSIISSSFDDPLYGHSRVRIVAPNLISLHQDDITDRTPMLERMPSLVKAFVRLPKWCVDICMKEEYCEDCICELCDAFGNRHNGGTSCVLLSGLSEAKSLALISDPSVIIFRADLRWCPTFGNLKNLLLNEYWCVPDFNALACILEHSPILEKLTLQLFSEGPMHNVEMKGCFSLMGPSAKISEHLHTIEIKCEAVDERVLKVLEFLSTFNICFNSC